MHLSSSEPKESQSRALHEPFPPCEELSVRNFKCAAFLWLSQVFVAFIRVKVKYKAIPAGADNTECARAPRLSLSATSFVRLLSHSCLVKSEAAVDYLTSRRSSFIPSLLPSKYWDNIHSSLSHHTFRLEMSYLNTKSRSIRHQWCHHWSASKSVWTSRGLQRPSLYF